MCRLMLIPATVAALTVGLGGCERAEYESAVEDYQQEKAEAEQTLDAALEDDVVDPEESEEVQEEVEEARSAYGEVAEKKGDLIESELD